MKTLKLRMKKRTLMEKKVAYFIIFKENKKEKENKRQQKKQKKREEREKTKGRKDPSHL